MRNPILFTLCTMLGASSAVAADHLDGPAAAADPTADIADLYAWMTPDATKVNIILTLATDLVTDPKFSDAVVYAIHVNSSSGYGEAQTDTIIRCAFYTTDKIECWAGDDYVEGDPSDVAGISSTDGDLRVFAGNRNDPFFFNLEGFNATVDIVKGAASSLTFDDDGCPDVDATTSGVLVTQLQTAADGSAPVDFFAGLNVLSIVLQVDKSLVNSGGDVLGIWASTHSLN